MTKGLITQSTAFHMKTPHLTCLSLKATSHTTVHDPLWPSSLLSSFFQKCDDQLGLGSLTPIQAIKASSQERHSFQQRNPHTSYQDDSTLSLVLSLLLFKCSSWALNWITNILRNTSNTRSNTNNTSSNSQYPETLRTVLFTKAVLCKQLLNAWREVTKQDTLVYSVE